MEGGIVLTGASDHSMFNAGVPCENVHSQARRMIMLSPEPNFWIHAVSTLILGVGKRDVPRCDYLGVAAGLGSVLRMCKSEWSMICKALIYEVVLRGCQDTTSPTFYE